MIAIYVLTLESQLVLACQILFLNSNLFFKCFLDFLKDQYK